MHHFGRKTVRWVYIYSFCVALGAIELIFIVLEELGRGGSGAVYKGVLADYKAVAMKRLEDAFLAQGEFLAEMRTIGKINPINLMRMWGFCSEGRYRLLLYEYVDNMSLDKYLFNSNFLGWKQKYAIAFGTAKDFGLAKLSWRDDPGSEITRIRGTKGFMAPEWLQKLMSMDMKL
ncbi:receptor kinase 1 [Olea europaea subsp. europaea]|uniref:Receptor kinase 1 n=1 Tax=Olea europaea subsp. europaea TaxID=158383 RepID=A0A8S0QYU3_OLEEU|nr:receptor kinase 1 [Olea europaea subsp. europaea]